MNWQLSIGNILSHDKGEGIECGFGRTKNAFRKLELAILNGLMGAAFVDRYLISLIYSIDKLWLAIRLFQTILFH